MTYEIRNAYQFPIFETHKSNLTVLLKRPLPFAHFRSANTFANSSATIQLTLANLI